MENTRDNFLRFAVLYWMQDVGRQGKYVNLNYQVNKDTLNAIDYIELTDLSAITDEDAIEVAKIWFKESKTDRSYHTAFNGKSVINRFQSEHSQTCPNGIIKVLEIVDFLRSRSYAVPYNGLSVKTMIDYNWIKLTS